MIERNEEQLSAQRVFLVGVDTGEYDAETSIRELEELAESAGAVCVGSAIQKRAGYDSATCIGEGKLKEISDFCHNQQVDLLIFDLELSATHLRNIEKTADLPVIDRNMLILDIFAQHAVTSEGKLQVELAQQKYILPRLSGLGQSLSRLGGGIGTRGPGESQLETDRRHIRRRISALEQRLREVEKRRGITRRQREKNQVPVVAIVGYTNAGKSTLLNSLTNAGVLEEDKLFATLDPTARALHLPSGKKILLVDTVGFIRRLPHLLIEAFKSTLEEAVYADTVLVLCDVTQEDVEEKLEVTRSLLAELGAGEKPAITVYNKCDLAPQAGKNTPQRIYISAKTGWGVDALLEAIDQSLESTVKRERLLLPYSQGGWEQRIAAKGKIHQKEYTPEGILLEADIDVTLYKALSPYFLPPEENPQ